MLSNERDWVSLDRTLPERVKGLKEWMVHTRYDEVRESVLKDYVDRSKK